MGSEVHNSSIGFSLFQACLLGQPYPHSTTAQCHPVSSQLGQTKLVNSRLLTVTPGRIGSVELSGDMEDRGIFEHLRRVEGRVLCEYVFRLSVWHVVKMNLSIRHLE